MGIIKNKHQTLLACVFFATSMYLLVLQSEKSDWHDFDVYYYAARAALSHSTIYILVGSYKLPFWYFPWTAWSFIPFAVWKHGTALILYQISSLLIATITVYILKRHYSNHFNFNFFMLTLACLVPLSMQLIMVGQMDYLLLGLTLLILFLARKEQFIFAGILTPFLLAKPHLFIPFIICLFLVTKRNFLYATITSTLLLLGISEIIHPHWFFEMVNILQSSGNRTDGLPILTFSSFLGFQENWTGTANIPIALAVITLTLIALWKLKERPKIPFLSLALAASVFCAPRGYAYDFPLIMPALIYLTHKDTWNDTVLWIGLSILSITTIFSESNYLVTVSVTFLTYLKLSKEKNGLS